MRQITFYVILLFVFIGSCSTTTDVIKPKVSFSNSTSPQNGILFEPDFAGNSIAYLHHIHETTNGKVITYELDFLVVKKGDLAIVMIPATESYVIVGLIQLKENDYFIRGTEGFRYLYEEMSKSGEIVSYVWLE